MLLRTLFVFAATISLCCAGIQTVSAQTETESSELIATSTETFAQRAIREAEEEAARARARAEEAAQAQIAATNAEIQRLKDEIASLQKDLNSTTAQKASLQSAIKALDLQILKLQKSVSLTSTQINQKDKEIGKLSGTISETEADIMQKREGIGASLRELEYIDEEHVVATLLGGGTLSTFFDGIITLESLRIGLQEKIKDLYALKNNLQDDKKKAETKRKELDALKNNLTYQKNGVAAAKSGQTTLLVQTKNKESEYQALIAKKQEEQAQFEQDLQDFEAQLGLIVAAGSVPAARAGVLQWPLDNVRITQFFGNTSFATQNPQIYGNKGHNAIDMAAQTGTVVKAARGGVVWGTGNTDATCPNASYGKWVFIKHDNGLSTLYAHLSVISVSGGQTVEAGEGIGYSGNTGYSTGPHLHFGVYATTGSDISSFASKSCKKKTYTMPVADVKAYLNPLSYLPAR